MILLTSTKKWICSVVLMICVATQLFSTSAVAEGQLAGTIEPNAISRFNSLHLVPAPHESPWSEKKVLALFFPNGSAVLTFEARRALDRVVPQLFEHLTAGGSVLVFGKYDHVNRPDETPMLAARRAEAVAGYLDKAWGIDPRRLHLRHSAKAFGVDGQAIAGPSGRVELTLQPSSYTPRQLDVSLPFSWRRDAEMLDLDDFGGASNPFIQTNPQ